MTYSKKHYYLSIIVVGILALTLFAISSFVFQNDDLLWGFIVSLSISAGLMLTYAISMYFATIKFDMYNRPEMKYETDAGFVKLVRNWNLLIGKPSIIILFCSDCLFSLAFYLYFVLKAISWSISIWFFVYILLFIVSLFFYAMSIWGAAEACIKAYKDPIPEKYKK